MSTSASSIPQALWAAQIPPAHHSPVRALHAIHHERPALQLPVTATAAPLRNLAVGLLADLYAPSLPWRLVVDDGVAWDIGDTFLNSVKEADFVRYGNANQIMKMSKEHTTQLWNSVIDNDYAAFSKIHTRLLNAPATLKHAPIRVYIPSTPPNAGGDDRKPKLLGQALKDLMPMLFPSSRDPVLASVVLHGVSAPFDAPLGEMMREAAYPDGWLCFVVVV
ncbi:hypothetical protein TrVGV298_000597 [Trichoderma virens]|nr:hypothetical protein TrVGV298_000597 [Trichoderma virens]